MNEEEFDYNTFNVMCEINLQCNRHFRCLSIDLCYLQLVIDLFVMRVRNSED
jgi:hypothetical protein